MKAKDILIRLAARVVSIEMLLQMRWEFALLWHSLFASVHPKHRRMLVRLRNNGRDLLVNLGCGSLPAPGFLNIDGTSPHADLIQRLGRKLDLPDGCAAAAFSEHLLEHLQFPEQTRLFLTETFRILRPGGHVRLIVPDAGKLLCAY